MFVKRVGQFALIALAAFALFAVACSDDDSDGGGDAEGTAAASGGEATTAASGGGGDSGGSTPAQAMEGGTLQVVLDRGELKCGVKDSQPGFGFLEPDGTFSGNDVEFCKALAAAIFGDSTKVEYVLASAADRFELLASGEIDVLIRTTTWTLGRDVDLHGDFTSTTFYDGQGMLVRSDSPIQSLEGLDGATICVTTGTTTEANLNDRFDALGLAYTPLAVADDAAALAAFSAGQCDGWTGDKSNLAGQRANYPDGADAVRILAETMSKEPLGPVTRDNDSQWHDIVQWVVFGMVTAEELGIDSTNYEAAVANPASANIARLLGVGFGGEAATAFNLGIDDTFMQNVLGQVGNYGEVYERTLAPIGLERAGSLNALWTEGGLIYAPPMR
ncbi:MAG: amino acid ABC transporter substrate-binding protein [Dehalococcoidia bacterium]